MARHNLPNALKSFLSRYDREYRNIEEVVPSQPYPRHWSRILRLHDRHNAWVVRRKPVLSTMFTPSGGCHCSLRTDLSFSVPGRPFITKANIMLSLLLSYPASLLGTITIFHRNNHDATTRPVARTSENSILPRTPVNKGKKEGRGCPTPRPPRGGPRFRRGGL
jgi:hypothetical protein